MDPFSNPSSAKIQLPAGTTRLAAAWFCAGMLTALVAVTGFRGRWQDPAAPIGIWTTRHLGGRTVTRAAAGALHSQQRQQLLPPRPPLPWRPLLSQQEVERGLSYYGTGSRLQAVAAKLLAGQPIKAFTLGGSVTMGNGATKPEHNYASRFFQFLNATFPHRDHVLSNKGIGATSSGVFAACLERMVPPDVDLVILEFSLNDMQDAPYTHGERRGYEHLVRNLLKLPGRPALIQLHHFRWWHAIDGTDIVEDGIFFQTPVESQLTVFAHYYDLTAVSVRAAVHPLMRAGIDGFKVDAVVKAGPGSTLNNHIPVAERERWGELFYTDKSHPTDGGHQVLAELLAAAVMRGVARAAAPDTTTALLGASSWPPGSRLVKQELPPPMIPGNADVANSLCAIQEAFKNVVVARRGFRYAPERPNAATFTAQKWAWTGLNPGAYAELEFDTRASSNSSSTVDDDGSDPDAYGGSAEEPDYAWVYISYLRSYEHMGTALLSCVVGCKCSSIMLDGTWSTQASLQQIAKLPVTQHPQCRIRVQIKDTPGSVPSDGHKMCLMGLMVSHFPVKLQAHEDTMEFFVNQRSEPGSN